MKTANKTALGNMVTTLANPKQAKPSKSPVVISDIQIVEMGSNLGNAYLGFMSASESLNSIVQDVIKTGFKPVDLRKAKKDSIEAKQTKMFKASFLDTMAGKVAVRTAQDYYELVAKAITSGKDITSTNPRGKASKGNAQKSKGGAGSDDNAKMVSALLNVWKLSDVASESLTKIESSIDNGMSLIEAITDYLESEGQDLSGSEAE